MINLLEVIYSWLFSVKSLYGKFIGVNIFVAIFSKVIVW